MSICQMTYMLILLIFGKFDLQIRLGYSNDTFGGNFSIILIKMGLNLQFTSLWRFVVPEYSYFCLLLHFRYGDDRYDRMWFPYHGFESINTSSTTDTLNESEYRLPPAVMTTAVRPINVNGSLEFSFDTKYPTLKFDVYMHFAELEKLPQNQHREFNIELNGNLWERSVVPKYLDSTTIPTPQPVTGSNDLRFRLYRTLKSTLPPILNAMEIYIVKDFFQNSTDQEEGMFLLIFFCFLLKLRH